MRSPRTVAREARQAALVAVAAYTASPTQARKLLALAAIREWQQTLEAWRRSLGLSPSSRKWLH